jgi:hypothetical protein
MDWISFAASVFIAAPVFCLTGYGLYLRIKNWRELYHQAAWINEVRIGPMTGEPRQSVLGFQHPIDARPADAESLGDLRCAEPYAFSSRACAGAAASWAATAAPQYRIADMLYHNFTTRLRRAHTPAAEGHPPHRRRSGAQAPHLRFRAVSAAVSILLTCSNC